MSSFVARVPRFGVRIRFARTLTACFGHLVRCIACVAAGIALAAPGLAQFVDKAQTAGVDMNYPTIVGGHTLTSIDSYSVGSASCACDIDGDGWTDLVVTQAGGPCLVFMNNHDGTFREEGHLRGLDTVSDIGGLAAGDFEKKGSVDLFMAPIAGSRYYLFRNDGTGHFTEVAVARGADVPVTAQYHQGQSISLVDYDRDGFLDIYVCEWQVLSTGENAQHSVLLHNKGRASPGFFENKTALAGLTQPVSGSIMAGYTALWADFDGDGYPDLFLAADYGTSQVWWNNGNGTFTNGTAASGVAGYGDLMGATLLDFDGDGKIDVFATAISLTGSGSTMGFVSDNKLFRNLGGRQFADVTTGSPVKESSWGWGTGALDVNNDGWPDLFVTNGMVSPFQNFAAAKTDPSRLFINQNGTFVEQSAAYGITDTGLGRSVCVLDYDNDGREDLFVTQTVGHRILYHNETPTTNSHWVAFKFVGTDSNRDGYGCEVTVNVGGRRLFAVYNPTNAYIGQREPRLHFGLGPATSIDSVQVKWPSGNVQTLTTASIDSVQTLTEPQAALSAPTITQQPALAGGTFARDGTLTLSVAAAGNPAPGYTWQKDGVAISGASTATLKLTHVGPYDAGTYHVVLTNSQGSVTSADVPVAVTIDLSQHSAARWWNEFLLDGIRKDTPNPPVHARNLYHLSAAMWDAFWAYQAEGWTDAAPVFVKETVSPADWTGGREAAQNEAISYAAYRVLMQRFQKSPGKDRSLYSFRWLMQQMGYDPDYTGTTGTAPADVGNRIGYGVLAATLNDGANEANGYADLTGYKAKNDPLIVAQPGTTMTDPSHWQPLALKEQITQNGIILPDGIQSFVGVNAQYTTPFALAKPTPTTFTIDPGPPPQFNTATHAAYVQEGLDDIEKAAALDPTDGVTMDISPGAMLNNPVGTNDGTGHAFNPTTNQPYAANVVKRGDYSRVLAEFWADGPRSETPPGHWNVIFNQVTDDPRFVRRFAGVGPVLSPLEWDVRGYLALNGAVHDAACLAWGLKRQYDSARPISIIRYLAGLGQLTDASAASYNPLGLPLRPGLIELVTAESSAPGQRHAAFAGNVGEIALHVWQGAPVDPKNQIGGVGWILAKKWVPYQLDTFVTPAFPGFMSGHSTFSRAAAEVMTLITGSPYFPGGLGEYHFTANQFLTFEHGPSTDVTLQWATYYDAADQAGISRLYGGIHPSYDDFAGRRLGSRVGLGAYLKAQALRHASGVRGLTNMSTRGRIGTGENTMIAGFVIGGSANATTLLRCVGPTLQALGIPADRCETDPNLAVHRASDGAVVLTNDNWSSSGQGPAVAARAAAVGAFGLASGSTDAAALADLAPGGYTVLTGSAAPEKRGIALAEVYGEQLTNLSTRGSVGAGDNVLIAGFVVDVPDTLTVLVRGVGPTLSTFGVQAPLANPVLTVYRQMPDGSNQVVALNDNWLDDARASLAADAAGEAGAFPLPSGSKDAALLLQLPAGAYTAIVSSGDGSEGVALAEVYVIK